MNSVAKAGSLIMVDRGTYSDYTVEGFCVVLTDFIPAKELKDFLKKNPKERQCSQPGNFLGYLIKKGYLMLIDYGTLYLGDCAADTVFTPFKGEGEKE